MMYPADTCDECGVEIVLDEPVGACYYTGRRCAPGGCDCGTTSETLCVDCADGVDRGYPLAEDTNPERALDAKHNREEADFNARWPR